MLSFAWLLPAFAFAIAMSATPGPNNAMVAASGANFGFRATVPHMVGISVGLPIMLVILALGAGGVLRTAPWVFGVLRWAGAAYLLFLAWKIATAQPGGSGQPAGRPLSLVQAVLFQWVNPKAWVVAFGAIVTFTSDGDVLRTALALAVIFIPVGLASTGLWTIIGVGAARMLRSPVALRRFNIAMACLLVASLLPLLVGE